MSSIEQAAATAGWLGESWGFWAQTAIYAVSALAATGALVFNAMQVRLLRKQIRTAEKLSQTRATVDVVLHERRDGDYIKARKAFGELKDGNVTLTKFACGKLTDHTENDAILPVLNHYEFIASAIREGAFDSEIYARMKRSLVVADWDCLEGYVRELRKAKGRPKLFVEFEWLANHYRSAN